MKVRSLVIRIVSVSGRKDSVPCLSVDSRVLLKNKHNAVDNFKWEFLDCVSIAFSVQYEWLDNGKQLTVSVIKLRTLYKLKLKCFR